MLTEQFEQLTRYLPKDVYMGESMEYASYHSRAISVNGENDLYTLEYFAFHILWVSFMQKVTFLMYNLDQEGVKIAFSNDGSVTRELENAQGLYDLSSLNEKKLCEIAKHPIIGFHRNKIDNMKILVSKRDHVAHCSGVLDIMPEDVVNLANQCLRYTEEIHQKLQSVILNGWKEFVMKLQIDEQQYSLIHDAVVDYLVKEQLSIKDILLILSSIPELERSSDFTESITRMQLALIVEDYDLDCEIDSEKFKKLALDIAKSEDQKVQVRDEAEAYVNFRIGLV
jgi:hypothetical protein